VATDPRKMRPGELCRLLNSTPLGEVTSERQIYRHRQRAGNRVGQGSTVGIANRANGQLYQGQRTQIGWTAKEIVLPTVKESAASGAIIKVAGLTGRIRGMKFKRPDGRTVRPSLVVLDDPQTDESARSLSQCANRESILAGAVLGLSGPTDAEFAKLTDRAKYLGATTSFAASEVASLMTELGRAGFKPDQIMDMTAAVMNLARATGTDATLASGIMAATIRQFGMEAGEATRVADGLTAAANKSFNSVESLGEALKYAAPVAADANMSLEQTLAILGSLGNMGIQGSAAGSALRRLLTLSAAESEKFQEVFNVATTDAQGNARSLIDVLGEVADATANLGSGERAAKFNEVFGLLGITAASAIGKSVTDTRSLLKELENAGGIAENTAQQMESGIGGAFRILKSSLEGVGIAIGESLNDPLKRMTQVVSGALSGLIKWVEKNQEMVRYAAKFAITVMAAGAALFVIGGALSALGIAVGGLGTLFSVVVGAIGLVGSLLGAILSPLGLVLAGIVGLGTYLVYSTDVGSQALAWLGKKFEDLKNTASKSFGAIGTLLAKGDIGGAAKILWLTLKMEWLKGTSTLRAYWIGFKDSILATTTAITYGMARIISDGWAGIEVAWTETIGFLADAWSLFAGTLTKTWHSTIGFIKKAWVRLKSMFSDDVDVEAEVKRIDKATEEVASNTSMLVDQAKRGRLVFTD
jgi:TP901 family phage tail tape measure protein